MTAETQNDILSNFIDKTQHPQSEIIIFGLVLYDESTPFVRKILRDTDFIQALNAKSGKKFAVFALQDALTLAAEQHELFYLVDTDQDNSLKNQYSLLLKDLFHKTIEVTYPCLLVFQIFEDKLSDYLIVPFQVKNANDAYNKLSDLLSFIALSVSQVKKEYYDNKLEIFNIVKSALQDRKEKMFILNGIMKLSDLRSLFKLWFS